MTLSEKGSTFLSPAEVNVIKLSMDEFLEAYVFNVRYWRDQGQLLFNFVTKFHILWHIADVCHLLNPRAVWCFDFEDFVGSAKLSAMASLAGTPMKLIGNKVLDNFLLLMHLTLSDYGIDLR